jgi:phosphohistidine phosphatase
MKHLLLIRHAKSSWDDPRLADHDRPLNKRGRHNLGLMAEQLQQRRLRVELLFSSSAKRALTTANALAQVLCPEQAVQVCPELYQFDSQPLWHFIEQAPIELNRIALVGHNPALMELAERLLQQTLTRLPTCAVLELALQIDHWHELYPGCAEALLEISPKRLG